MAAVEFLLFCRDAKPKSHSGEYALITPNNQLHIESQ
jgi:hypothetical protein